MTPRCVCGWQVSPNKALGALLSMLAKTNPGLADQLGDPDAEDHILRLRATRALKVSRLSGPCCVRRGTAVPGWWAGGTACVLRSTTRPVADRSCPVLPVNRPSCCKCLHPSLPWRSP
jgi:hypothetical protein